jgi:branched-chain amino acid transport system substrate-binding protein
MRRGKFGSEGPQRSLRSVFRVLGSKRAVLAAVTVTAGLAIAGCGGSGSSGGSSGGGSSSVTLATLFPMSGPNAVYGVGNLQGVHVGLDAVKQRVGGMKGVNFNLATLDSQALPSPAVQGMNEAVHVRNAPIVLTAFSSVAEAVAPIANQTKTVVMQGGASSPGLAKLGPYFFNNLPLADAQLPAMLDYLIKQQHLTKWAVIYTDEPLGQSLSAELKTSVPAAGASVVSSTGVSVSQTDFSSVVAQVRAEHPDVVYLATSFGGMTQLESQLRSAGITAPFATFAGTDSTQVVASKSSDGMVLTGQSVDFQNSNPFTSFFNSDFKKRYPKAAPNTVTVNYANEVLIAAKAIMYLKSKGKAINGSNIAQAIHTIKTFDVVGGKVTFQPNGTVVTPIDIVKINNNKESVVKTYPASILK